MKLAEGQAYALDVFRIQGGSDHLYSLHGPPGPVSSTGLQLVPQGAGSYAGADVAYREMTPPGPVWENHPFAYGYSWVGNVERDRRRPAASCWIGRRRPVTEA